MVFVKLPPPPSAALDLQYAEYMQSNLSDVIRIIAQYDGMLAHLSSDDKGVSFHFISFNQCKRELKGVKDILRDCVWDSVARE